jgi:hypothetical protein
MVSLTSPAPKCWSRNSDEDVDSTNGLAIRHADRTYEPENSQDTPGLSYAFLLVGFNTYLDINVEK